MPTLSRLISIASERCLRSTRSFSIAIKNLRRTRRIKPLLNAMANSKFRLQVGCGPVKLKGWVNTDIGGDPDLFLDISKRFPFPDGSIELIFSEHVIEHIIVKEAISCLSEFHRVIAEDGVVRIAMPDLDYVIKRYEGDWKAQEWLGWKEYSHIQTRAEMLNIMFRSWEHRYLYNEEELTRRLKDAGFQRIERCQWGKSPIPELRGLETRKDSMLILEARKQ